MANRCEGFALPSSDTVLRSFLENAIPIAFASLLEPFWVVLNRLLCVLRPFEDLRTGSARSATAIYAQYTALPPQLSFWRALRSRHYVLATLCIIVISSNALAVALSVVFNEASVPVELNIDLSPTLAAGFLGDAQITSGTTPSGYTPPITYSDHFYVVMANISHATTLPPWMDNNYFYLPRNIPLNPPDYVEASKGSPVIQDYTMATRGFGVAAQCQLLLPNAMDNGIVFKPHTNDSGIDMFTRFVVGGKNITCVPWGREFQSILNPGQLSNASSALETVRLLYPLSKSDLVMEPETDDGGFCNQRILMGWARIGSAVSKGAALNNATKGRSFDYRFVSCQQQLTTIESGIRIDASGRVLSATNAEDTPTDAASFSTTNDTRNLISQLNSLIVAPPSVGGGLWHTDAFTSDWLNSVLKVYLNGSSALVDPAAPLPGDFSERIIPAIEDVIQRLSAVIISANAPNLFLPFQPSSEPLNTTANTTIISNTTTLRQPQPLNARASPANTVQGDTSAILTITETRIFMDPVMFRISIALLACHLLMAIAYYAWRPKAFLPRMPTTIASLLAFVSMSRAVADVGLEEVAWGKGRRTGGRYAYGRFVGVDGGVYVGIERAGRVVSPGDSGGVGKR